MEQLISLDGASVQDLVQLYAWHNMVLNNNHVEATQKQKVKANMKAITEELNSRLTKIKELAPFEIQI
jgi:hypothetical protein